MYLVSKNISPGLRDFLVNDCSVSQGVMGRRGVFDLLSFCAAYLKLVEFLLLLCGKKRHKR